MNIYNVMTCHGKGWSFEILGDCSMAWISLVFIFFLALVLRRQCEDGFLSGQGYNFPGSLVGGLGLSFLIITFTGSAMWGFVLGIVGIGLGGFGLGLIMGGSE